MILCPLQSPCRITQRFGARPKVYGKGGHDGIDFSGKFVGMIVPAYAPFDSTVKDVIYSARGFGNHIVLWTQPNQNNHRREILMGHFSSIGVTKGQWVNLGDEVGKIGKTGFADGVHLHMRVRYVIKNGTVVNARNGHDGHFDYLPYLLFWNKDPSMVVFEDAFSALI